jgi:hypothetical protein
MTERKPPDTSFISWIDQQIAMAEKRGAFDDLPGAGKPIPRRSETDYLQVWLRDYLRREGVPAEDLLPVPLRLRKEIERLAGAVRDLRSEQEVREHVRDLNRQIMDWRRNPVGPPLFVPLIDEDKTVSAWRDDRPSPSPVAEHRETPPRRRRFTWFRRRER